ncbi:DMT family transporter [Frigidibacter sp. SD6-1]|uniref:DMT family transporter n=1 Tax=Frigidibacter sp. SD6-1 TaxID=3032581 RepID=UPI0024DF49DF|nr:DMT family transporter [Frigidibacter sp. SD6-1]
MAVSDNLRGAALMCAAMVAFTVNDTFMKAATVDLPVLQAIAMRGVVTSLFLLAIAWRAGAFATWPGRTDRFWLAMRTLGEVLGTLTFLFALKHMPIANLSAILQSLPLAVTLAAAVFLGTPVGWRRLTAILIGFAGVMMIIRPGTEAFDRWSLLGVVSVACVVLRDISTRKLSASVPSPLVALAAAVSVGLSAGLALPFTGIVPVSAVQAAQVAGAAAFLIVGYLTVVMTMRVGDISVIAPFRYVSLVAAIGLGWAVFGQFPDRWTLAGSAIVVATGIYAFLRERRLVQRAQAPV